MMILFKDLITSKLALFIISIVLLSGCNKDDPEMEEFTIPKDAFTNYTTESILIGGNTLQIHTGGIGDITILFESGAGAFNGQCIGSEQLYFSNQLLAFLTDSVKFIAYDRAGYFSTTNGEDRDMEKLTDDLHEVILDKVDTDKLILVGSSWGGYIIRYYAIRYPDKVDALLFLDPDHESADINSGLTQEDEDGLVNLCLGNACQGCAEEYEQLIETIFFARGLPNLPDIPVRVISASNGLYEPDAHARLGSGVTDFKLVICDCPHEISEENPEVVFEQIQELINSL